MRRCIIFGGSGYIGTMLARHFAAKGRFDEIVCADIRPPTEPWAAPVRFVKCDVRQPIGAEIGEDAEWIFNLAAVHREPGHEAREYYETNLAGASSVCDFATKIGCRNLFFTSSIATYGPTRGATLEDAPKYPTTPYGITKLLAEMRHQLWQAGDAARRLVIVRPGVIYGPGDPGNILRMIRAIQRGYFFFPGSVAIRKSYGYIYGLIESIDFMMARQETVLIYNYVEEETETIGGLAGIIRGFLRSRAPIISFPMWVLSPAATAMQVVSGGRSPIHPVRVKKAATPTWIIPSRLKELGFSFRYSFRASLVHWQDQRPNDFA